MDAKVYVTLKKGVFDPQGEAVLGVLKSMGFDDVTGVRIGKYIEVKIDAPKQEAETKLDEMCKKLLSNPVIESYKFEIMG